MGSLKSGVCGKNAIYKNLIDGGGVDKRKPTTLIVKI